MNNRARGTGLETRIYRIECGFRVKYAVKSLLRSESCRFGHTLVEGSLVPSPTPSFSSLLSTVKLYRTKQRRKAGRGTGNEARLKADPTVQEVSPRTVPVRHQRDNKKPLKPAFNQRLSQHSIH